MSNKIWHRALHRRKIWKELSLFRKTCYYMQPFGVYWVKFNIKLFGATLIVCYFTIFIKSLRSSIEHVLEVWFQPLPFPTILKVIQSFIIILTALLPVIYPTLLLMWTYAELQFILARHFDVQIPKKCDLICFSKEVLTFRADDVQAMFMALYLERWRLIATALTSSIDYFRMTCYLLLGFGE